MRQLVFLVTILCLWTSVLAQTYDIQGVVINAQTGVFISGASIQEVSNMANGTSTDSSGKFNLSVSTSDIIVKHLGYESQQLRIATQKTGLVINLLETTDVMNQVVVSGNKTEKKLKELTMSLEILSPDIVRDKNPINLDEVVNQIPGVQVTDDQINIRAGSGWSYGVGSRVTVLVDGTPLINGESGSVQWNFMSMDHLASIEVLKGASSVLYGSSALNGIININSKWPGEKPRTSVTLFGGAYSTAKRESLKWTDDVLTNSGIRFGDSRKIKGHDLNTTVEYIDNKGYRFGDHEERLHLGADWRKKLKNDMFIGVRSHVLLTDVGSFLLWKSYDSAYLALDDAATKTNGLKFRIDPFWVYKTKKNWLHKINSRFLRVVNNVDSGNPDVDQSNSANTYYADYQVTSPVKAGWQTIGGAMYTASISSSPLFGGDQNSANAALYAQIEKKVGRLIVNAGGRLEHYVLNDFKETKPVFRSGLNFRASKATFFRASYGQGYRFPTIAESYIETKVGAVSVFPNSNLGSETGWNAEVGVKQGFKMGELKGFIDVAAFQMSYRSMMEFAFSQWSKDVSIGNGLGLGFKSVNTGDTRIRGIDLSLSGQYSLPKGHTIKYIGGFTLSNPVSLEPNKVIAIDSVGNPLTYLNTSSDTSQFYLKYRSRHLFKMDVQYSSQKWEGGVSVRYNSQAENIDLKFVIPPLSIFIPGIAEGQSLNETGTWLMDLRLFYKIRKDFRLGLIANNVFNKEFVVRPADMGAPRLILLQIRKDFGL